MTAIQNARDTLVRALKARNIAITDKAILWLLGLVIGENNFGTSRNWSIPNELNTPESNPDAVPGPSYNWGSVKAAEGAPFIWHLDKDPNGNLHTGPGPDGAWKFARFDNHDAAANRFLSALLRSDVSQAVANVLADPNATSFDLARAMYTRNVDPSITAPSSQWYYSGTPDQGDDAGRIKAYTNMIEYGAKQARQKLDLPAPIPNVKTPTKKSESSGWWWQLPVLAAIAYQVTKWGRRR